MTGELQGPAKSFIHPNEAGLLPIDPSPLCQLSFQCPSPEASPYLTRLVF